MDETPRPANRRLPLIGAVLIVGGIGGLVPRITPEGSGYVAHVVACLFVTLAGLFALALLRRPGTHALFLGAAVLATAAILFLGFVEMFQQMSNLKSYGLFHVVNTVLLYLGAPVMWGAALARRADPLSPEAQKAGRLSAGAVQLGFVFLFASEMHRLAQFPSSFNQSGPPAAAAFYALLQLSSLAERILLLWASVTSVRTALDGETVVRRAVRIHRLMGGWLLLGALSVILSNAYSLAVASWSGPSPATWVWRSAVLIPLTFAVALAVANRLAVRNAPPDAVTSGNPLSGA